ncbi:MAG: hypothetical protein KME07_02365 [Pegethrix bostrychoides GSE-TBD4-15B]|jgi:hypothetical protein|uniref:Uncharacterized protein n=1 Tax=Pegethrix bostrychoides GSE-TBD4-15B TaxID=2839662 RepID=A0A951P8F6_9CYAN|nr:hypothetical protein [Pegethrix bostrychoides GSE-TBD4-15B]
MNQIKWRLGTSLTLGLLACSFSSRAEALPGQPVAEVATWMQSQPTIQPAPNETLLVRRTDSPSRRFSFQASITAPGRATAGDRKDIIRSETITLFDTVYGVSQARLEEALGIIYGEGLAQDYATAVPVLTYPTPEMLSRAESADLPLLRFTEGELRQGNRFGYWVETVQTPSGKAQNGRITVLLLEDLPKLTAELERR